MPGKCGRRAKTAEPMDARQKIIDATVALIKRQGADSITVRNVLEEADLSIGTFYHHFQNKDDLLMYFVREAPFDTCELQTPMEQFPERICELYFYLIDRYMALGEDFMRQFYTTGNKALSAYMGEVEGGFADGTVMARCQREAELAMTQGILKADVDAHTISKDICTIVKGCVFEWVLSEGSMDIKEALVRIVKLYCDSLCADN